MNLRDELRKLEVFSTEWPFYTYSADNPGICVFLRLPWKFYRDYQQEDWEPEEFIHTMTCTRDEYLNQHEAMYAKALEEAITACQEWAYEQPSAHAFRAYIEWIKGQP